MTEKQLDLFVAFASDIEQAAYTLAENLKEMELTEEEYREMTGAVMWHAGQLVGIVSNVINKEKPRG